MESLAIIEVRDDAGKWFADCENPKPVALVAADQRVAQLRAQGFKARARLAD